MADDILDLALQITADPTQAQAAIGQFADRVQSAAQAVQAANEKAAASFTAEEQAILSAAGISEKAAQQEIEIAQLMGQSREEYIALWQARMQAANAAAQNAEATEREAAAQADAVAETEAMVQALGAEVSERNDIGVRIGQQAEEVVAGSQTMGQTIRSNLGDLAALRRAFYSVFFFSGIAYLLPQLEKMGEEVQRLSLAWGGFSTAAQDAFAQAGKAFDAFMEHLKGADYTRELLQNTQKGAAEIQKEIDETQNEIGKTQQEILHGMIGGSDILEGLREKLKELQAQQAENSAQEEKLSLDLAKETTAHHKAAKGVNAHNSALEKLAQAEARAAEAIATAQVRLPPFIVEIDRLSAAISHENSGLQNSVDILKSYQQIAKEMSETPAQLGFEVPNADTAGVINAQIQQVTKLTEAERDRLPTERELSLAIQELTREYPNLTNAERQEWAQVMLTSTAYRQHIEDVGKADAAHKQFVNSLHNLTGVWGVLGTVGGSTYQKLAQEAQHWANTTVTAHQLVIGAMTAEIGMLGIAAAVGEQSYKVMLRQLAEFIEKKAEVKAAEQVAEALSSWPDAAGMAAHFAAAAAWMALGGAATAAAGAVGYGSTIGNSKSVSKAAATSSVAATGTASTTPPPLASGTQSANAAAQNQQQTIQIIFQGAVYGGKAATDEIIRNINAAVSFNRAQLKASHTPTGRAL